MKFSPLAGITEPKLSPLAAMIGPPFSPLTATIGSKFAPLSATMSGQKQLLQHCHGPTVGWSALVLLALLRKWTHICLFAIFFEVQFQKIHKISRAQIEHSAKFSLKKIPWTLKINILYRIICKCFLLLKGTSAKKKI